MNFKEIDNWPNTWKIGDQDIEYGNKIIKLMKPFILSLADAFSSRTVKRHADNLWVLGGYAVELVNVYEEKRHGEPCFFLTTLIDSFDGPHIHDLSEEEQRSFDCTCRKFYKYLVEDVLRKIILKPEKPPDTCAVRR